MDSSSCSVLLSTQQVILKSCLGFTNYFNWTCEIVMKNQKVEGNIKFTMITLPIIGRWPGDEQTLVL
jgi:hypothetical protein